MMSGQRTMDQEMKDQYNYIAPQIIAEALSKYYPNRCISIIDYACGTGLVGVELQNRKYKNIDALDISVSMLEKAKKKGC